MNKKRSPARLEELLDGAVRAFSRGGYYGTTTAEVAREIGVSQPYVIQTFGSKSKLFIAAHRHASAKVIAVFTPAAPQTFDVLTLGRAYRLLMTEQPETLGLFSHGAAASVLPDIAAESRRHLAAIHHALIATGASELQIRDFMGRGLLINIILSMQLLPHADELDMSAFLSVVFSE